MMRKLILIASVFGILLFGVLGVGVMSALRPEPEKSEEPPKPLTVFYERAEARDVALTIFAQGEVAPKREISLVAQVPGRIVSVSPSLADGGVFEQGDVLARIEEADFRLALIRAEAAVAQAQQALAREQAEADLARRDVADLGITDASPLALREPQLAEARANVAAAEADLAEARLNLSRTIIRAPFNGRVREQLADEGQFMASAGAIANIFSTDVVEVRLPLSDLDLAQLELPLAFTATRDNPGPSVRLSAVLAGREQIWTGRLARTDAAIDPRTRVLNAIVEVDDPYGAGVSDAGAPLAVGLFVSAELKGRSIPNAVVIPRAGLRGNDQVYVLAEGDTLDIRTVTVARSDRNEAIITAGLADGDRVAISPVRSASQGMSVTALRAGEDVRQTGPDDGSDPTQTQTAQNTGGDRT
ncbi:MAG: efflux RND transporter periplasmic adaptor subunit [Maricaulaceae bacterium]